MIESSHNCRRIRVLSPLENLSPNLSPQPNPSPSKGEGKEEGKNIIDKHSQSDKIIKIGGRIFMKQINEKGVTLLELVIVMVIIAIGAVLMVPNMGRWLQHYQLRSATRDIVSTMRTAQMRAVSTNMDHRVSFTIGNPGSYILQRNSGDWMDDGARQTLPTRVGLTVTSLNFEFNPNSTATAGNATLTIQREGQVIGQKIIRVLAATGKIRIDE